MNNIAKSFTAIALAAGFSLAAIAPASADQAAATRNEIIGGLALVAGIATAINVSNKNAEAQQQYDYGYGYGNNGYDYGNNGYRNGRDNRDRDRNRDDRSYNDNGGNRGYAQRGWQR
jgi:hypothetical protein